MKKTKYKVDEEQLKQLTEKELKSMAISVTNLNKGIVFFKMVEILDLDEPITLKQPEINIISDNIVEDKRLPEFDKMDLVEWLMYNFDYLQQYPIKKDSKSYGLLSECFFDDSYNVKTIYFKTEKLEWQEQWYQIDIDIMYYDFMWTRYVKLREEQLLYLINCKQRSKCDNTYVNAIQIQLENITNEQCYQNYFEYNYANIINQNEYIDNYYDDLIDDNYISESDSDTDDDSNKEFYQYEGIRSKFCL